MGFVPIRSPRFASGDAPLTASHDPHAKGRGGTHRAGSDRRNTRLVTPKVPRVDGPRAGRWGATRRAAEFVRREVLSVRSGRPTEPGGAGPRNGRLQRILPGPPVAGPGRSEESAERNVTIRAPVVTDGERGPRERSPREGTGTRRARDGATTGIDGHGRHRATHPGEGLPRRQQAYSDTRGLSPPISTRSRPPWRSEPVAIRAFGDGADQARQRRPGGAEGAWPTGSGRACSSSRIGLC
jgi:hypothetical protein